MAFRVRGSFAHVASLKGPGAALLDEHLAVSPGWARPEKWTISVGRVRPWSFPLL